jgi:hypothetical protein
MHIQQSGYHSDLRNIKSAIRPLSRTRKRYEITIRIYYKKKIADFAGMIAFDKDDEEILLWKTQRVKVDKILETEPGYFSWIQMRFPCCTLRKF